MAAQRSHVLLLCCLVILLATHEVQGLFECLNGQADIPEVDRVQWRKIDAQLCSVLWQSVDPRILLHLQAYKTCFKFWTQAKGLYTNDIQRLYKVASAIVHISQQDLDLPTYIGQIASLKEEFLTQQEREGDHFEQPKLNFVQIKGLL